MAVTPSPSRGEVVRGRLAPAVGSEQAGERPALVISPDLINERSPVVLIAAITSQTTERIYPFEALIEPPDGGLLARSKIMLMHLRSVDKERLVGRYGKVSEKTMQRVEEALKVATGLTRI
ncbi:MAG: type II toxin-antitoxin system PemK/MazF family toxin [Chloroflexi bacterium]|nr:type II toxin-antitoxin system PemK/MazF family toxin [Chloroflexota bacterium]